MALGIMGNCKSPANVPGGKPHADLVAAKCEAGVWQYLHAYNGTVELQARTTEHMRAFLHVLGYTTPKDFFEQGNFRGQFRRLWAFAASICFFSQEAITRQRGTAGSDKRFQSSPLFRPDKEQLVALGIGGAKDTARAQHAARGIACKADGPDPASAAPDPGVR